MIQAYAILVSALMLSVIAAYFSILGLIAIFSSAPIAIALMGVSLELAKLATASWLYNNWKQIPISLKYYLTTSVVILSLITSMGIFGYLSKAHLEHQSVAGVNIVELKVLEQQEKILQTKIDFLLKQSEKQDTSSRRIENELTKAQADLKEVVAKKTPLLKEKNALEVEVGPLKYITELIYGKSDEQLLGKAVRWVIVTLIFVFDPLAILLLISFNLSYRINHPGKMFKFDDTDLKSIEDHLEEANEVVQPKERKVYEVPPEIMRKFFGSKK